MKPTCRCATRIFLWRAGGCWHWGCK